MQKIPNNYEEKRMVRFLEEKGFTIIDEYHVVSGFKAVVTYRGSGIKGLEPGHYTARLHEGKVQIKTLKGWWTLVNLNKTPFRVGDEFPVHLAGWQSDWNGDEVGYDDFDVVGLYSYGGHDYYIDMETNTVLERLKPLEGIV